MPGSVLYLYPTDRLREMKSSISFRKGPVKVGSAKTDHLLKVQGAFRQPFHIHLEIHGGGIRVQVSDDIGDDRERGVLLQKDACHGMAEPSRSSSCSSPEIRSGKYVLSIKAPPI